MSFAKRLSPQVGRKWHRCSAVPVPRRDLSLFKIFKSNRPPGHEMGQSLPRGRVTAISLIARLPQ